MSQHQATVKHHIVGFILSLLLTFAALFVVLKAPLAVSIKLTVIVVLAILQMAVQLVYFMHVTEGSKLYQVISLGYGIFVAVCVVAGSIWIMLYNTMHL
ncbi:cytochrome aa3 quinol oxidase subunit IV [Salinithrix halophila]|uniref:Quinol oxidase subunit 4 n=1 Tax=Salinithrix halophila TaxID=1485204 RepID=A0ABV8JBQ8_9BACL